MTDADPGVELRTWRICIDHRVVYDVAIRDAIKSYSVPDVLSDDQIVGYGYVLPKAIKQIDSLEAIIIRIVKTQRPGLHDYDVAIYHPILIHTRK